MFCSSFSKLFAISYFTIFVQNSESRSLEIDVFANKMKNAIRSALSEPFNVQEHKNNPDFVLPSENNDLQKNKKDIIEAQDHTNESKKDEKTTPIIEVDLIQVLTCSLAFRSMKIMLKNCRGRIVNQKPEAKFVSNKLLTRIYK